MGARPRNASATLGPRASTRRLKLSAWGVCSPASHFDTDAWSVPIRRASATWLSPAAFLAARIAVPMRLASGSVFLFGIARAYYAC